MAEISFAKHTAVGPQPQPISQTNIVEVVPVESTTASGAANPIPANAVAVRPPLPVSSPIPLGDQIPDFADIILPRINIVQKVGELSTVYPGGAVVFGTNGQYTILSETAILKDGKVIKEGTAPLEIIVLGFKAKRFVEKVEGGGRSPILNSEAEVVAAGGTLSYQEWELKKEEGMRLFQPMSEALIAIAKPEIVEDKGSILFSYDIEGRKYALALWAMKGGSFTKGAKVFFTARSMGILRTGYPAYAWNLATRLEKYSTGNFAYVPVVTPKAATTSEVKDFVAAVLSGAVSGN